jgi:hypothetical protein
MFGIYQLIKTGHILTPTDYYQKYREELIKLCASLEEARELYETIPSNDRSNYLVKYQVEV